MSDAMDWLRGYIALEGPIATYRISRGTGAYVNIKHGDVRASNWLVKTWAVRPYEIRVGTRNKIVHVCDSKSCINKAGRYRSWEQAYRETIERYVVCQCLGAISDEWAEAFKQFVLYQDYEIDVLAARDLEIAAEQQEDRYRAKKAIEEAEFLRRRSISEPYCVRL